jgi:Icc-related predicted phosphoesterase
VKPAYHVFGHIHEGYGSYTDGTTIFINSCTCDDRYCPVLAPIVFDMQPKAVDGGQAVTLK